MATAIAKREKIDTLRGLLEQATPKIQQVVPKHLTAEKIVRLTTAAVSRTPALLECTPISILQSVMVAARLGLEPDGVLGSAYLVPYRNKSGAMEAQLIPGYRGLIDLARRSGAIVNVWAHPVYENDTFEVELGLEPKLRHVPTLDGEPGRKIAVYAAARFKDGETQFEAMTAAQIAALRKRSRAGNNGPWVTDEDEMWRKTAVRRLCKYLPLSPEMAAAMTLQAGAEKGESTIGMASQTLGLVPEGDYEDAEVIDARPSKTQRLASQIKSGGNEDDAPPFSDDDAPPEAKAEPGL